MASPLPGGSVPGVAAEVTTLFRTKRVSEIRHIESRVRTDAEDKSEALRNLLGTRYKDLLHATDSVLSIRDKSKSDVTDALRDLARSATQLRERFLANSAYHLQTSSTHDDEVNRRKQVHLVGEKLKHIVDSPETLYACLESGRLYDASVRFAGAKSNYEELKTYPEMEGVANRFAEQQWQQVNSFHPQIVSAAQNRITSENVEIGEYACVFAALVLLRKPAESPSSILKQYLEARSNIIRKQLSGNGASVCQRIHTIAVLVRTTIVCIAELFRLPEGQVLHLLRVADDATLSAVKSDCTGEKLHESCARWVEEIRTVLKSEGREQLAQATTSKEIADLLGSVEKTFSDSSLEEACLTAVGKSPSFLFDIFKPLISERANVVAREALLKVVDTICGTVDSAWNRAINSIDAGQEIWTSITSCSFVQNEDSDDEKTEVLNESCRDDDVAKALATTGPASDFAKAVDDALGMSLADVDAIVDRIPSVCLTYTEAVRESLPKIITELQRKVDSLAEENAEDLSEKTVSREAEQALFVARAAATLLTSRHVARAYLFDQKEGQSMVKSGLHSENVKDAAYKEFRSRIENVSWSSYKVWASRVCRHLQERLESGLKYDLALGMSAIDGSNSSLQNGLIRQTLAGDMRCARSASVAAVRFAIGICAESNRAGGLALPREALGALTAEMSSVIAKCYTNSCEFHEAKTKEADDSKRIKGGIVRAERSDAVFLQMLFDLRFFGLLMHGSLSRGASSHNRAFEEAQAKVQASIDPIELASCTDAMDEAACEYASRTRVLFGAFCAANSTQKDFAASKTSYVRTGGLECANIMTLASTVDRFSYLPAPMPSTYSISNTGAAGLKAKAAVEQLRHEAALVSQGATNKKQTQESSVADYASKVSESMGRLGSRFLGTFTRSVG